ncbi:MAG: AsmA family protein [Pseudomonadota bacterium]|nr:AsmA family protein [Pseudomonadota bacterium]
MALGILGLLLVLAAVVTWLVMGFDANRYKGVAVEWMKTHHDRTLTINGPIGLSLFPRLQVTLADVSLSEAGRPDEFAALERAELAVDVVPLLSRELVIGRIAARGVRANYLQNAQGVRNIDDLLNPKVPSDTVGNGSKKPPRLDINSIDLENLRLHIQDDVVGVNGDLMVKSLTTGRLRSQTEAPVELALQVDLKTPAVQGELSGDTHLTLDLDTGSAKLRDMNLAFKGDALNASAIRATLKGSASWDGATSAIEAQAVQLNAAATAGALKIDSSTLGIARFTYNPAAKDIGLTQLKFEMKGTQDTQALSFALDWPELAATGDQLKGSAFSGCLQRGGAAPLDVSFKSAAPTGSFDTLRLPGVEATLASGGAQRKVNGTVKANLVLRPAQAAGAGKNAAATPASVALDALTLQGLIENPGLQPLKVSARGAATASSQRASWNLAGDLNGSVFNTDGQALLGGAVPKLTVKARFDTLDLNRLLADAPPPTPITATAPAAKTIDTPVDLSALRSIDGQFSLQAGTFAVQRYRVSGARIEAAINHGLLRVSTLQGKVWGGSVDASALADASSGRVGIKGAANGIDINAALKDVAAKDWMDGTGRVTMDIEATGRSVNEMKSALQGQLALQLRDGAIKGINLAKSLRQAKAAIGLRQDAVQKANESEKTDFSELGVSFQIAGGVARSKDLDVKSPFLRLGGEGAVDIGKGRIDYLARATVTGTSKGQDGADLAALKGLQVPVRLNGPFEALDWKIEWSSVIAGAVTQQLKNDVRDRLEEKLGLKPAEPGASAPKAKPKDALKGLLKGLLK